MSVLLSIPDDVVHVILHDWIELVDLARLDMSLTNKRLRQTMSVTFASMWPLYVQSQPDCVEKLGFQYYYWTRDKATRCFASNSFYEWTFLRKIRLKQLVVVGYDIPSDVILKIDLKAVEVLVLSSKSACCVPLLCPSLKLLEIKSEDIINQLQPKILSQLPGIYLNLSYCRSKERILDKVLLCTNLTVLRISFTLDAPSLIRVFVNSPQLFDIQLLCENISVLESINQYCSNIGFIHLTCNSINQQKLAEHLTALIASVNSLQYVYCATKERSGHKSIYISQNNHERTLKLAGYGDHDEVMLMVPLVENLTSVAFKQCYILTSATQVILKHSASTLKSVNFEAMMGMESLQKTVQCPLLESIHWNILSNVRYHEIFSLPHKLTDIHLIMDGSYDLTTVNSILKYCLLLKRFFFGNVRYVVGEPKKIFEEFVDLVHGRYCQYEDLRGTLRYDSAMTIFFELGKFCHC